MSKVDNNINTKRVSGPEETPKVGKKRAFVDPNESSSTTDANQTMSKRPRRGEDNNNDKANSSSS